MRPIHYALVGGSILAASLFDPCCNTCQNHTDSLGAFEQLDDHRGAADHLDHFVSLLGIMREGGDGQAQTFLRQNLQGPQFVARPSNGDAFVQ
jgi:hypothetical protein